MISPAHSSSSKISRLLLRFTHGGLPPQLYTTWTDPVVWLGERYEPTPSIEVTLPENTIALQEPPCTILMPLDAWTDLISSGLPHADVQCEVRELIETDQNRSADVLYVGTLREVARNPRGNPNAVKLDIVNIKARLEATLGIQVGPDCSNLLGDVRCKMNLALHWSDVPVVNVGGTVLLVAGLPVKPWRLGKVPAKSCAVELDAHCVAVRAISRR